MRPRQIADQIYWVGVNDTETALFENQLPLPHGIAYNAYFILDQQVVLLDTVKGAYFSDFLDRLQTILKGRKIDMLVINHMEPDHSGAVKALMEVYPSMKLVGNAKTKQMAQAYFQKEMQFIEVQEGESIEIGEKRLQFHFIPMVHWPETMVAYEPTTHTLFSNDAFGGFGTLNGGIFDDELDFADYEDEMLRYYANIVGRFSPMVQKALQKLGGLSIRTIASSHGMVWRKQPSKVVGLYDRWSRQQTEPGAVIAYGSMYGNTEALAFTVAEGMRFAGLEKVLIHNLSTSDHSAVIRDIWRYKGLALGSCTYNLGVFPKVDALVRSIDNKSIKNRVSGLFGSYTWSGGALKALNTYLEKWKWALVEPRIEFLGSPTKDDHEQAFLLGKGMAQEISRP